MEGGEGRIEGNEPALPPAGEFHQPSVGDLPVALNLMVTNLEIGEVVRPEFVCRKITNLSEFFPSALGGTIGVELHVEAKQRSFGQGTSGKPFPTPDLRRKPIGAAVIALMIGNCQCDQDTAVEEPSHDSVPWNKPMWR